jgi:hypothetical protein
MRRLGSQSGVAQVTYWLADPDAFDFDGYEGPVEASCKKCGKHGLQWDDSDGRWTLIESDGKPHICNPNDAQQYAASDFKDEDL